MGGQCCRQMPSQDKTMLESTTDVHLERDRSVPRPMGMSTMNKANSMSSQTTSAVPSETSNGAAYKNGQTTNQQGNGTRDDPQIRQQLMDFYKAHNPSKLNDEAGIDEILRRYKGREQRLFSDLNRKYVEKQPEPEPEDDGNNLPAQNTALQTVPTQSPGTNDGLLIDTKQADNNNNNHDDDDDDEEQAENSPLSPSSNRKISKQKLSNESPPESENEEADHPILADLGKSESTPINGTPTGHLKITVSGHNKGDEKKEKKNALAEISEGMFKIEVTKPSKKSALKKKPLGTSLFGGAGTTGAAKPAFTNSQSSGSYSSTRSTSFIAGSTTLHSPQSFGGFDQAPKAMHNIQRSHTLTLAASHKDNLNQRRQSSLAVRRNNQKRNLPIRINKVWEIFAQYIVDKMIAEKEAEKKANQKDEQQPLPKPKQPTNKFTSSLSGIDESEDPEVTPEPLSNPELSNDDILDMIINSNKDDKNKKKRKSAKADDIELDTENNAAPSRHKKGHESVEVLAIDPRLFADAKNKRRESRDSESSNGSNTSSDDSDDLDIDPYQLKVTHGEFNVVLNNNKIQVSPDMSCALVWQLLDVCGELDDEIKSVGQESDNLHNDPMKERGFHKKQFKKIDKCHITYEMITTLMTKLANGVVTRQDKSLHPKHLSYEKRNFVIWDKMFEHLINKTAFNVEEDYLYGALQEEDLRDGDKIIEMMATLDTHWQHRVQLMEHIDDKLNSGSPMERDIFFASILADNENFIKVLNGWSVQLTDDRSGVARTGVVLLPAVLSSILLCIQYPAIIFDENEVINPLYDGIFTLVKNRRLKDMADDAYESLIQVTDILAQVASDLEDYSLLSMIINILETHTNVKQEKHDKCRESCVGAIGFLLYGVEPPIEESSNNSLQNLAMPTGSVHEVQHTPIGALSEKDRDQGTDDIKMPDIRGLSKMKSIDKADSKLSKNMQRKYLLDNEEFVTSFGNILLHGVTDRSESARKKAFTLLARLESEQDGKLLEELISKWDFTIKKKFDNYKKLQSRKKKNSSIKPKKGKKKKGKGGKKSTLKAQMKAAKKKAAAQKDKDEKPSDKSNEDTPPKVDDSNNGANKATDATVAD